MKTHDDIVGTSNGYQWHKRNGSEPCDPCRAAHNERQTRWRDSRSPDTAVATVRVGALARLVDLVPADRRAAAFELLGDETANRIEHVKKMLGRCPEIDS